MAAYTKYNDPWEDDPSTDTPVVAAALDHIEQGIADATPAVVSLTDPTTDKWADITIVDDGSSTTGWVDRFQISFDPVSGSTRPTFWLNEYGEARGMPAKDNTVGYRVYAALDASTYTTRSASTPVLEVVNQRDGTRTTLFGVYKGGRLQMSGNEVGVAYTFASGATVNNSTVGALGVPAGTVILREV